MAQSTTDYMARSSSILAERSREGTTILITGRPHESITVFTINRSQTDALNVSFDFHAFGTIKAIDHLMLDHPDPHAVNTADAPRKVTPRRVEPAQIDGTRVSAEFPSLSWNVLRFERYNGSD
ncbi:hypothetical protein BH23CHL5_BH23CHL5_28710 [soil metagenome]